MVNLKKTRKTLHVGYNSVPNADVSLTLTEIKERLRIHFRKHIGAEEATSPVDIFAEVFGADPYDYDIFRREYFWNIIKTSMKLLKKEVFIIKRSSKYFVLKTQEEANDYHKVTKRMRKNLDDSDRRADDWVNEKKWRRF